MKSIKSLLYDEGYTIKGAQNSLKKRTFASESVKTNVAEQPSSGMRQSVAEDHLHKAESLLEEANKILKTLLGRFDR